MLIRLVYVSKAVGPQTPESTHAILRRAQAWNAANAVTGVLCEGQGVFLQVLEGPALVAKHFLPLMPRGGRVVFAGSVRTSRVRSGRTT